MKHSGQFREVMFWLLLLGSWQLLMSRGTKTATIGASGTAVFLLFACRNLGRLNRLGLAHAGWRGTSRRWWLLGAAGGLAAGVIVFGLGSVNGQTMMVSNDWRLVLLQVTLGPVLEEIVFRGYLFSLLAWASRKVSASLVREWLVVVTTAVVFALAHLAQPGVGW